MTQFLSSFSSNNYQSGDYFGGHYGPVSAFTQIQSYTLGNLTNYLDGYKTAADGYPNIFDIIERISAGYLMDTMDFGKLHVVAGVRFEGTQMNTLGLQRDAVSRGQSRIAPSSTGCGVPVAARNNPSYVDILPSLSLRYALDSNSSLRLVYARGVARPPTPTSWSPMSRKTIPPIPPPSGSAIPDSSPNMPITTICSTSVISILREFSRPASSSSSSPAH